MKFKSSSSFHVPTLMSLLYVIIQVIH